MPDPSSYSRRRTAVVLFSLWLGHFSIDSFSGVWPIYKTLVGLDLVKAGLIASVGGFLGNGLQLFFGFMGDRGWSRFLICLGVIASGSISFLSYVDRSNYGLMGVITLLCFLGSSSFHPVATGTASTISTKNAGKVTALFLSGGFIGYAFSQLLFTTIYRLNEGKTAIMFIFPLLVSLSLLFFIPKPVKERRSLTEILASTVGFRRPLFHLYLVMVCASAVNIAVIFILPDFLRARGASHWVVFGGGHLVLILGGCVGLFPSGYMADRYGPRQVMLGGLAVTAVFLTLITYPWSDTEQTLVLLFFFLGMSTSVCNIVGLTYGSRLMPREAKTVSGLLMGCAWCLGGISTVMAGWLADPAYGGTTDRVFIWLNLFIGVALVCCSLLPRIKK